MITAHLSTYFMSQSPVVEHHGVLGVEFDNNATGDWPFAHTYSVEWYSATKFNMNMEPVIGVIKPGLCAGSEWKFI